MKDVVTGMSDLTPVESRGGILLKRDDLYRPFGDRTVNGGKLRQCMMLVDSIHEDYSGLISCCSIYSPQAPITAAVGQKYHMPTVICYGGTTETNLKKYPMPIITKGYGAKIVILSKSGIHKILYNKAREIAKKGNLFVVDYGFNIADYSDLLLNAVSRQVENIPDDLENLVITCGSGVTTIGILIGLHVYKKKVKNIYLVCTAPDRSKFINGTLHKYGIQCKYKMADLFHQHGFKYERGLDRSIDGLKLHPQYEAKAYDWIQKNIKDTTNTLLWIVGVKPCC